MPAHTGENHAVLRLLNDEMSRLVAVTRKYGYPWTDGISPVSSSLFLAEDAVATHQIKNEADLPKLTRLVQARKGRLFKNMDHVTFLDGYHPFMHSPDLVDELAPSDKPRRIFAWLLTDLLSPENGENVSRLSGAAPFK